MQYTGEGMKLTPLRLATMRLDEIDSTAHGYVAFGDVGICPGRTILAFSMQASLKMVWRSPNPS
jgi:hypothetical protein